MTLVEFNASFSSSVYGAFNPLQLARYGFVDVSARRDVASRIVGFAPNQDVTKYGVLRISMTYDGVVIDENDYFITQVSGGYFSGSDYSLLLHRCTPLSSYLQYNAGQNGQAFINNLLALVNNLRWVGTVVAAELPLGSQLPYRTTVLAGINTVLDASSFRRARGTVGGVMANPWILPIQRSTYSGWKILNPIRLNQAPPAANRVKLLSLGSYNQGTEFILSNLTDFNARNIYLTAEQHGVASNDTFSLTSLAQRKLLEDYQANNFEAEVIPDSQISLGMRVQSQGYDFILTGWRYPLTNGLITAFGYMTTNPTLG